MASLRYQAAHKFLEQHSGKSKHELLLEIAKISNSDITNDLLYYLIYGYLPREEKVRLRKIIGSNFKMTYCLYLFKDYRFLNFDKLTGDHRDGDITTKADANGVVVRRIKLFEVIERIHDQDRDCFVDLDDQRFPYINVNYNKYNPEFFDGCRLKGYGSLFEENLFSPEIISWLEKEKVISHRIEVPREYLGTSIG